MNNDRYKVIFNSQEIGGQDLLRVKGNIRTLFGLNNIKVDLLFSGKPLIIKKNLSRDEGEKYCIAINKAGGICRLESMEPAPNSTSNSTVTDTSTVTISDNITPELIPCPSCKAEQQNPDICDICGFSIYKYNEDLKAKGLVYVKGSGVIQNRRLRERRLNTDRRQSIRMQSNRRTGTDRRLEYQAWNNT